jgi:phage shock protein PspC (stress-responsive transcriptional regulator)
MNKIININLAGRLIPIDDQAYDLLNNYLAGLKQYFAREDGGAEILHDMEDRIGELFQEKIKKGSPCISIADVNAMMEVMGSPQQIVEETGEEAASDHQAGTRVETDTKRFSRSSREKVIGGVCGGVANYFNIDPAIVRVLFAIVSLAWGTGILIYLLLWALLPESDMQQPGGLKRRLYRDEEHKLLGGVCSGIAAYLNIDIIWPRLIFLLPALSGIGFGILDADFLPFTFGGVPSMALLYIILWAALPKATSIAEKLEMHGKKVDVKNLSAAIKDPQTATKRSASGSDTHILSLLFKIFLFFVGGVLLIAIFSGMIALLFAFFSIGSSVYGFPLGNLVTDNQGQKWLLYIALFLLFVIPLYGLIKLMVYLISGRKKSGSKWWRISLIVLFVGSIFSLFWIGGNIARDFKIRYHKTEALYLQPIESDTLLITQDFLENNDTEGAEQVWINDDIDFRFLNSKEIAIQNMGLSITKSPDSLFHLEIERSAYGRNAEKAKTRTRSLTFNFKQEGNKLYLPKELRLSSDEPFRGQQIIVRLMVPEGKIFYLEGIHANSWSRRSYGFRRGRFSFETDNRYYYDEAEFYKMNTSGEGTPTRPSEEDKESWD